MASGAPSLVGWSPTSRTHPALMRWGYGWGRIDDPQDRLSCSFKYLAGHFESLPFHQFASGERNGKRVFRRKFGETGPCGGWIGGLAVPQVLGLLPQRQSRCFGWRSFVGSSPVSQAVCHVGHGMSLRSAGVEISSICRNAGAILSI